VLSARVCATELSKESSTSLQNQALKVMPDNILVKVLAEWLSAVVKLAHFTCSEV
jgi:hypothetical protein